MKTLEKDADSENAARPLDRSLSYYCQLYRGKGISRRVRKTGKKQMGSTAKEERGKKRERRKDKQEAKKGSENSGKHVILTDTKPPEGIKATKRTNNGNDLSLHFILTGVALFDTRRRLSSDCAVSPSGSALGHFVLDRIISLLLRSFLGLGGFRFGPPLYFFSASAFAFFLHVSRVNPRPSTGALYHACVFRAAPVHPDIYSPKSLRPSSRYCAQFIAGLPRGIIIPARQLLRHHTSWCRMACVSTTCFAHRRRCGRKVGPIPSRLVLSRTSWCDIARYVLLFSVRPKNASTIRWLMVHSFS